MIDSSNICLSCGLCCDGTLIGHVQLEPEEIPALKKIMDLENENGNGFFLQPCNNYCDGCTIYSERPKQCASFKCELLNSVEEKELDFNSAVITINTVKEKKVTIEKKVALLKIELKSQSFHFKMVELKKVLKKKSTESPLTHDHLELLSDLEHFDSLLFQKFGVS